MLEFYRKYQPSTLQLRMDDMSWQPEWGQAFLPDALSDVEHDGDDDHDYVSIPYYLADVC